MVATPLLLRRRFVAAGRIFITIQTTIYVPPLMYLQMRLEAFLLTKRLALAFRIRARRRVRSPHMSLKFRPGGEEWQGG